MITIIYSTHKEKEFNEKFKYTVGVNNIFCDKINVVVSLQSWIKL